MARTEVKTKNIFDGAVTRDDLNSLTSGQAVIKKLVAGTNVTLSSTGADTGTGDVTVNLSGATSNYTYTQAFLFGKNNGETGYMNIASGGQGGLVANVWEVQRGIIAPRACTLKSFISVTANSGNASYQLRVNGTTVKTFAHTGTSTLNLAETLAINAGDEISVNVSSAGSGVQLVKIELQFTETLAGLQGLQGPAGADGYSGFNFLTGNVAPAGGTGVNGDVYLDNTTGDFYKKLVGSWVLQANLKGPIGTGILCRIQNTATTNVNSSATGVQFANFNTSTGLINTAPALFTPATDGVTCVQAGTYRVSINLYATGSITNGLVGIRATVATTETGSYGTAYIRNANNSLEGSAQVFEVVNVTAGQKIGFKTFLLGNTGTIAAPVGLSSMIVEKIG